MKKHIMIISIASLFVLAGCEQNPKMDGTDSGYDQNGNLVVTKKDKESLDLTDKDIERLAGELIRQQQKADQACNKSGHACESAEATPSVQEQSMPTRVIVKEPIRQEKVKITGVGYGAENNFEGFTDGQRRLMAIRASKLDAYRALAEQIYGIKIDSNTSVATLTAQSDSFRARVNAVVRGARIVSITPMADNNYETVLEVFVDRGFFEDVFVYSSDQRQMTLEPMETCTMGFNCYDAASYR
jgi:hypothetical protein